MSMQNPDKNLGIDILVCSLLIHVHKRTAVIECFFLLLSRIEFPAEQSVLNTPNICPHKTLNFFFSKSMKSHRTALIPEISSSNPL